MYIEIVSLSQCIWMRSMNTIYSVKMTVMVLQDAQVAQQYKKDRKAFDKQAAEWTKKYASKGLSIKEQETKIKKLMEMGIKRDHARAELAKHGWDTEAAINAYFGN